MPRFLSRPWAIGGAVVALGAAALVYIGAMERDAPKLSLAPDNPQIVQRGKVVYTSHCAACHGAKLEGQPNWRQRGPDNRLPAPPHDATGHTWHHSDALLFKLTKYGPGQLVGGDYESNMPGYENTLDNRDIVAVLSYIKSTWPTDVQRQHDALNERSVNQE